MNSMMILREGARIEVRSCYDGSEWPISVSMTESGSTCSIMMNKDKLEELTTLCEQVLFDIHVVEMAEEEEENAAKAEERRSYSPSSQSG